MPTAVVRRQRRSIGHRPMTLILCGTADTIPGDVLAAHIRAARSGRQRLVIIDEGSQMVRRHIDHDWDRLIDPSRGNWDIFADHIGELELATAGEAMLHQDDVPPRVFAAASCVLAEILWHLADEPGAGLWDISNRVRALAYAAVAEQVRLDLDDSDDTRAGWMILALLQECAGRFAARSLEMPLVSIGRWHAGDMRSILFIAAGAGVQDGACRSVNAAIARIIQRANGASQPAAFLAYGADDDRPTQDAVVRPTSACSTNHSTKTEQLEAMRREL